MIAEEFASGKSFTHRLDPRVKLIVAGMFSLIVALADRPEVMGSALLISLSLLAVSCLNLKRVSLRLLTVNGFILLLWLFLPFTYPGDKAFGIGPLHASWEGIHYSLLITVKSNAIVIACLALLATTPIFQLVHALSHLRVPMKLIQLFFFTYRYIHVIYLEYLRITQAMKIRCFYPKTNIHTYRNYAYLVGMLLIRSFDRSERVQKAMSCRGFKGKFWTLDHFIMKKMDWKFLFVMIFLLLILAFIQWKP